MRFHDFVYGSNIALDKSRRQATRINDQCFCDGIVFSNKPVRNQLVTIEIESTSSKWKGYLNVGVTSKDPVTFVKERPLPNTSYPIGLCQEAGVWIKPLPPSLCHSKVSLLVSSSNQLQLVQSNEVRYSFLTNLPSDTALWLIFDIFGRTKRITIVDYSDCNFKMPISITLQGPNTVNLYQRLCHISCLKYNWNRIFCVGPPKSRKTILTNLLIAGSSKSGASIGCVEGGENNFLRTEQSCYSDMNGLWIDNLAGGKFVGCPSDESMFKVISYNIVKEQKNLKGIKEDSEDLTAATNTADILKSALKLSSKKADRFDGINELDNETVKFLPTKLREMIDIMLSKPILMEGIDSEERENQATAYSKYNFWDFKSDVRFFFVHQILLTSQAVYLIVVNIDRDLDQPIVPDEDLRLLEAAKDDFTSINIIHQWLSLIYCQGAQVISHSLVHNDDFSEDEAETISKPIAILVGITNYSLNSDQSNQSEEKIKLRFQAIRQSLEGKAYNDLVHPTYIALNINGPEGSSVHMNHLKSLVDEVLIQQQLIDQDVPFCWVEFETIIEKLNKKGIFFADINQLYELARAHTPDIKSLESLFAVLEFYHFRGRIYMLKSQFNTSEDVLVVLDPVWMINCFSLLFDRASYASNSSNPSAIILDDTVDQIWANFLDHKAVLLGILEKLDMLLVFSSGINLEEEPSTSSCELPPQKIQSKMYLLPWIANKSPQKEECNEKLQDFGHQFQFSIDFNDLLPIGLFSRFVVRLCRWSWRQGWGRRPDVYHLQATIPVDVDHNLHIKVNLRRKKFFARLIRTEYLDAEDEEVDPVLTAPSPNVCVKVRHLIESEMESLQHLYYRRIVYTLEVPCPCDLECKEHLRKQCPEENCLHFISLNKCLNKKLVECDYRQIRTNFIQRFFPILPFYNSEDYPNNLSILEDPRLSIYDRLSFNVFHLEPSWMRDAARMLISHNPGRDWLALARRLGYSEKDVAKLVDEVSPSLALINDWFESNGRTRYCIDVLLSCLKMISREDVGQIIEMDMEPIGSAPPIFISYQWDSQETILDLRRRLELAGFPCWMDIGLMGGGDSLYGKIYEGISRSRVIIACLTPRYVISRLCVREITLADVLHKPILPVMIEPTPWPPPGPMAVVMSSLVFVDLCGIGGHGGVGKLGDSDARFKEILTIISRHIAGSLSCISSKCSLDSCSIFSRKTNPRFDLSTISPLISGEDSIIEESRATISDRSDEEVSESLEEPVEDQAEATSDLDDASVLSRLPENNRITNCSICNIF